MPGGQNKKKFDHQEKCSYFQSSFFEPQGVNSETLNNFPDSQLKKFPDAARESVTDLHKKKSCYLISFISEKPRGTPRLHEVCFFFTMAALNDDDLVDYDEEEAPKPPMVWQKHS